MHLVLLLGALGACNRAPAPPAPPQGILADYQCNRCHDGLPNLEPAKEKDHCVHCHQGILAGRYDAEYKADYVARWQANLYHHLIAPDLEGIDGRLRRDWLVEWLQHPHDLRPQLPAEMPRMPIDRIQANAIADALHLVDLTEEPLPDGDIAAGNDLMRTRGCLVCHAFEVPSQAASIASRQRSTPQALAPDLRHVRARMRPSQVEAWLTNPAAISPHTTMPPPGLSERERLDVSTALFRTPLTVHTRSIPERLPPLERAVSWTEVSDAAFRKVCWHCHSNPEFGGDGGPGAIGGFGYAGKDLDLSSEAGLLRGSQLPDGTRRDLLAMGPQDMPIIVEYMMARHAEVAGNEVPNRLGMPLGLSPLSLEQIQLVETWALQHGPTRTPSKDGQGTRK